jgi:hypothetical protein
MNEVAQSLGRKLDPRGFTAMSDKMAALVRCVLGDAATFTTDPAILHLHIDSSGAVIGTLSKPVGALRPGSIMKLGEYSGFSQWIGSVDDFTRNWQNLIVAAELTREETIELQLRYDQHVTDHRVASHG